MAARSARTRRTAACGSSGTCRSTSPTTAPTTAPIRGSSSKARSRACRPTSSRRPGQLWGNPLYDWTAMRADGYRWWIERFRRTFELVDLTRVDHFRGFVSYWAVPEGRADRGARPLAARAGRRRVPRRRARSSGELAVVAEDLGVITEPVVRLRRGLGFPGHGRPAVRARPGPVEPASAREPSRAVGRLHGHARQRHDARLVDSRSPPPTAPGPGSTPPIPPGR